MMERTEITISPPIGTIETPRKIRKVFSSFFSSEYYYNLIAVIYTSILPPNVPKKTTPADLSISENFKNIKNTTQ